jgi:hypothetical protein
MVGSNDAGMGGGGILGVVGSFGGGSSMKVNVTLIRMKLYQELTLRVHRISTTRICCLQGVEATMDPTFAHLWWHLVFGQVALMSFWLRGS